eukprot:TRINITY_DN9732_c0_g2_i1.p1 TRINITY_DN9732_c0_g2~~TRINITY_DN9732_c0_g2_i1.p1  ORF type:complete len:322 (+),score=139.66 TRINITY_DN9732_c0_g2_i1:55-1020(+)
MPGVKRNAMAQETFEGDAARVRQLEELLAKHGVPVPPPGGGAAVPKRAKRSDDEQRRVAQRCRQMKPFVAEYAPYGKGFGVSFVLNPQENAAKMWNRYYSQNTTLGFKDRHYLTREVDEIKHAQTMMECGCGVGNAMYPILAELPHMRYYAFDLSEVAVKYLKTHEKYDPQRVTAFAHDLTAGPIAAELVPNAVVDVATFIFVLSAIAPQKMPAAIAHLAEKIRPGGLLYFRDYCEGDLAQTRFGNNRDGGNEAAAMADGSFMRTCGTCSYFFTLAEVAALFGPHFDVVMCEKVVRDVVNNKKDVTMNRVWVHAKLRRRAP